MDAKMKRIIALVGHAHCGKTTLAEGLLYAAKATTRKGDVMQGTTVSDFHEDEIERKNSINASYLKLVHQNHQVQIVDTPGYSDFIGETVASLRAVDGAVVVVDAVNGVEVGTEDVWDRLTALKIPRVIFINKTDKSEANIDETVKAIKEQLSPQANVLDLNSAELTESVAESDDQLLEKYLDSGSLSPDEVKNALGKAVKECKTFPIIVGSAVKDEGFQELLDAIVAYLPSPIERKSYMGVDPGSQEKKEIPPAEDGPFLGFIFKSHFDPHLGQLSLMRVIRGTLSPNSDTYNVNKGGKERVSTISLLQGKEQATTDLARAGDIVALAKLKHSHVNDCLCDPKEKVLLDAISFPEPSISASIKPKTRADEGKISESLHRLCEEDHTLRVHRDNDTKEMIMSGIGDLHLKTILNRMKRRYNVDVELGRPKVSYRETITKQGRYRYKYKKQSGGRGQYGDVDVEIAPLPRDGAEYEFINKIFGGAIPKNFIPSAEKGVKQAIHEGVLAGYPIINVQVKLVDGSYHDVDSSDIAFQIAGTMAMKEAVKTASPVLLEPYMDVSIVVPDEFIGQISGDISSRRGRIMGSEAKGKNQLIKAQVPIAEMFTYANDLRSLTGGRGSYSMKFSHYEQAPAKITQQVIDAKKATANA